MPGFGGSTSGRARGARPSRRRRLLAALAGGLLLLGGPGRAAAAEAGLAPEPEWSVNALLLLGGASDGAAAGGRTGAVASGVELLLRWRWLLAGGVLAATAADGRAATAYQDPQRPGYGGVEGAAWGLSAGGAWEPSPGTRLQLVLQGGRHEVRVESNLVLPAGRARLPFAGAEAGAVFLWGGERRHPVLLFARRAGFVVQASLRADLGRATVRPGVPPEVTAPPVVRVGGVTAAFQAGAALEW